MQFRKFTEKNEWEGETWHFWLQVDGNEAALERLGKILGEPDKGAPYQLTEEIRPESEVDALVENAEEGYLYSQNKATGVMTIPDHWTDGGEQGQEVADALYKGGVTSLLK